MATYTSTTTGLWSAGATWVGGVTPPSAAGHKIIIAAGHTVTLDVSGEWGDDTSSSTVANNAIVVNGALKFSRSASASLTCRGTIAFASGGGLDMGTEGDPIPSGVTADLILNFSSALAAGKHGLFFPTVGTGSFYVAGVQRTRNTTLASSATAGATSITVSAASNWAIGDVVVIATDTNDPARVHYSTVSSVSGTTIGLNSALNFNRASGCRVGNLSSNATIKAHSNTRGSFARFVWVPSNPDAPQIDIRDCTIADLVTNLVGWAGIQNSSRVYSLWNFQSSAFNADIYHRRVSWITTAGGTSITNAQMSAIDCNQPTIGRYRFEDCNAYLPTFTGTATAWFNLADKGIGTLTDCCVYSVGSGKAVKSEFGAAGLDFVIEGGYYCGNLVALGPFQGTFATVTNVEAVSPTAALSVVGTTIECSGCTWNAANLVSWDSGAVTGKITDQDSTYGSTGLAVTSGPRAGSPALISIYRPSGSASDYRAFNSLHYSQTDSSTRNRGVSALRMKPGLANVPFSYTFQVAGSSGVPQRLRGYLRFDATYGTANPPVLAISGLGVSQTITCPATADTWHAFDVTITPSSTGNMTLSLSGQSASTNGYLWLDGLAFFPFTRDAWHYGFLPTSSSAPSNVVDPNITLSEAAVSALSTIETLDDAFDASKYWSITNPGSLAYTDLCAASANVLDFGSYDVVVDATAVAVVAFAASTVTLKASTLLAGTKFTKIKTSGTISFINGAAAGSLIVYEDSSGVSAPVVVTGVRNGSKVRVIRTDTSAELAIGTAGASGFFARLTWTTDLPIRANTAYCSGLDAEQEAFALGSLTVNGASLTVVQSPCAIYEGNGIDGSTVTGLTLDAPNIEIDADEADNAMTVQEVYAWFKNELMTDAGMRTLFGAITPENAHKYRVNTAVVPLKIDQKDLVNSLVLSGGMLYRDDGASIRLAGSGVIEFVVGDVYESQAAEQALASIKAKTDSLAFTVAGQVDANVQSMNNAEVLGDGTSGNKWRGGV